MLRETATPAHDADKLNQKKHASNATHTLGIILYNGWSHHAHLQNQLNSPPDTPDTPDELIHESSTQKKSVAYYEQAHCPVSPLRHKANEPVPVITLAKRTHPGNRARPMNPNKPRSHACAPQHIIRGQTIRSQLTVLETSKNNNKIKTKKSVIFSNDLLCS